MHNDNALRWCTDAFLETMGELVSNKIVYKTIPKQFFKDRKRKLTLSKLIHSSKNSVLLNPL